MTPVGRLATLIRCGAHLAALQLSTAPLRAAVVVDVNAPTTMWTVIQYANNSPDPTADQQGGSSEGDIIGNAAHPSAYTMFGDAGTSSLTDGTLGFRVRLGGDANAVGFKGAFFVGLDANLDGALDLFVGVNNSGSTDSIGIWNPGTGLNVSPSTTSIVNPPVVTQTLTLTNYSFVPVTTTNDPSVGTNTNLDGAAGPDYFLSFSVPFASVVSALTARGIAGFNQSTPLSYVVATATQDNSLNQDLNGIAGAISSSATFASLGVTSTQSSADGTSAVPEPATIWTAVLLLTVTGLRRQRRSESA